MEDTVIKSSLLEKLQVVLQELSDEEMELVEELFYLEKTEREAAKRFAVSSSFPEQTAKPVERKVFSAIPFLALRIMVYLWLICSFQEFCCPW